MSISMNRWKDKVAVVTGASAGIGAVIVTKLVEAGLQVAGFARSVDRLEQLAKKLQGKAGKLHPVKVDITKEEDILQGFKWVSDNLGPVNILVNNAGILPSTTLTDGDTETWKKTFDTNVLGLCIATREAVKSMKANNIDGHIIHINSVGGHIVPNYPNLAVYPASKYAVTALTETLRQEFNQLGLKIKITSISPGGVNTEMVDKFFTDRTVAETVNQTPLLNPEDVANAVIYALSTPPHVQIHEMTIASVGERH